MAHRAWTARRRAPQKVRQVRKSWLLYEMGMLAGLSAGMSAGMFADDDFRGGHYIISVSCILISVLSALNRILYRSDDSNSRASIHCRTKCVRW